MRRKRELEWIARDNISETAATSFIAASFTAIEYEQFTLSRERMRRMPVALVVMRSSTPADPKTNRKMLHGALSLLAPDSSLRRKLARCGKRDPAGFTTP